MRKNEGENGGELGNEGENEARYGGGGGENRGGRDKQPSRWRTGGPPLQQLGMWSAKGVGPESGETHPEGGRVVFFPPP